jgi:solute carrier family 45 protein 1/2/4
MAHVSYSLYFTDYVGEAVFGGDPTVRKRDNDDNKKTIKNV